MRTSLGRVGRLGRWLLSVVHRSGRGVWSASQESLASLGSRDGWDEPLAVVLHKALSLDICIS